MLNLQFAITREDYNNYYLFVTWDAPGKQRSRSRYYLRQMGTIILFTAVFYFTGLFDRSSWFAFLVISFILLTSVLSITGVRSSIRQQAEKISNDPENAALFNTTNVIISETGISLKDEFTARLFQWPAFIKKQENEAYYFLFYSSLEAIIIPKKIFKFDEHLIFQQLLSSYLSFDAEVGYLVKN